MTGTRVDRQVGQMVFIAQMLSGFVRVSVRKFIARSWAFHLIYASRGRSINTNFFLPGRKRETNGFCFIVPTDVLRTWTAPPGIAISLEYITFDYRRSSADAQTMGFVTQNSAECGIEPPATIFPRGATENKIRKRRRRRRGLNGTRQTFTTVVFRVMGEYIVKKIHNNNKSAPPAAPDFLKDSFVWVWNRGEKNKRNDYII